MKPRPGIYSTMTSVSVTINMIFYGLPIHHKVLSEKMWKVAEPLIGNLAFQAWGTSDLHAQAGRKKIMPSRSFLLKGTTV